MRFSFVGVAALVASAAVMVDAQCGGPTVRREIRTVSPGERDRFFNAFRSLKQSGQIEQLAASHNRNQATIHSGSNFLVWHRAFTDRFAQMMRGAGSEMYYWRWEWDYQAPHTSAIYQSWMTGGNGDGSGCVRDGLMGSLGTYNYPSPHCLQRRFNGGNSITPWWSDGQVAGMISSARSYNDIRNAIEFGPHPFIHSNTGGDVATMYSPNDILFFLHHAEIDRIYYMWQLQNMGTRRTAYDGNNQDGSAARLTDPLPDLQGTVGDYMDPRGGRLCYTYDDLGGGRTAMAAATALPQTVLDQLFPDLKHNPDAKAHFKTVRKAFKTGTGSRDVPTVPNVVPISKKYAEMMNMNWTEVVRMQNYADAVTVAMNGIGKDDDTVTASVEAALAAVEVTSPLSPII